MYHGRVLYRCLSVEGRGSGRNTGELAGSPVEAFLTEGRDSRELWTLLFSFGIALRGSGLARNTLQWAVEALDEGLARGLPIGCQTGAFWLPYFPPAFRFHFNMHNLVVIGREGDHYLISDPVFEQPVRCASADLLRAIMPEIAAKLDAAMVTAGRDFVSRVPIKTDVHIADEWSKA